MPPPPRTLVHRYFPALSEYITLWLKNNYYEADKGKNENVIAQIENDFKQSKRLLVLKEKNDRERMATAAHQSKIYVNLMPKSIIGKGKFENLITNPPTPPPEKKNNLIFPKCITFFPSISILLKIFGNQQKIVILVLFDLYDGKCRA